uniref:Uncharacterized protein n=1 Tax=viral metagenome TaxID=1070528 RepID=A0A6C0LU58_9ZZZZ
MDNTNSRTGHIWSASEEENLIQLFKDGNSLFGISQQHKRSEKAVEMRLKVITMRLYDYGISIPLLSEHTGQSIQDIRFTLGLEELNKDHIRVVHRWFYYGFVLGLSSMAYIEHTETINQIIEDTFIAISESCDSLTNFFKTFSMY